jgi:hypothetical protein
MKYKPMNEQMSHEFFVFNDAQYECVKHTNYEWMNFWWFSFLNCKMLSLWCYLIGSYYLWIYVNGITKIDNDI